MAGRNRDIIRTYCRKKAGATIGMFAICERRWAPLGLMLACCIWYSSMTCEKETAIFSQVLGKKLRPDVLENVALVKCKELTFVLDSWGVLCAVQCASTAWELTRKIVRHNVCNLLAYCFSLLHEVFYQCTLRLARAVP